MLNGRDGIQKLIGQDMLDAATHRIVLGKDSNGQVH